MTEVTHSREFACTAEQLWSVVSDRSRLADWVPTMQSSRPSGGSEVQVAGDSHGHRYAMTSDLRVSEGERRLDWGSPGANDYRGSLRVAEREGAAEASISIWVPRERIGGTDDLEEIRRGMDEAFDRLAGLVQG